MAPSNTLLQGGTSDDVDELELTSEHIHRQMFEFTLESNRYPSLGHVHSLLAIDTSTEVFQVLKHSVMDVMCMNLTHL